MARGSARRDLYIQVSGDTNPLRTAMMAGKTIINDFGGSAINVIEEVEKEMAKLGTSGLPALKQTERAYQDTFRRIAESARAAANAPSEQAAAQILDANATREAVAAATAKAQSLRTLAEAAARADKATEGGSRGQRAYAVATAVAATNAENETAALREQLAVLEAVERELGTSTVAHRKQVAVSGEARAGYQQLSYQLGDIATQYASGTSMSLIFAQQSAQVVQAIGLINGESKGLIGFLGGAWGIAITSAVVMLTPWVAKLLEGNDALGEAIEKLKKDAQEAETSRQAHAAFAKTLDGQIEAQRRLNDEMERGLKSQREISRQNLQSSMKKEADAATALAKAQSDLANAREQAAKARARVSNPNNLDGATGNQTDRDTLRKAEAEVARLKGEVAKARTLATEARQGARDARIVIAVDRADAAVDPIKAINDRYTDMRDAAIAAADGNDRLTASLEATVTSINRQRDAAVKAEQDKQAAQKRTESDSRNGKLTPTEVGNMLKERFGGSFSGSRSAARNAKVGGVANSRHLRDQAVDFVPSGGMGAVSKDEIRAYLASQGVNIEELLGPGDKKHDDHFHVGFSKTRRTPEAIGRSAERAENQQTQNEDAYASLVSRARDQQLRIEQSRLVTISELADNDRKQVDLAREDIDRAAQKGVELKRWTQAEADAVKLITERNATEAKAAIDDKERIALRQQTLDSEISQLGGQAELLQLQGQLAGTARDRRRVALELLDIETQQARKQIERQMEGEKDPTRRAQLADELGYVNRNAAVRRQVAERQNASPLQQYRQELADFDIEDELETAEVRFFDNLNDQLADSATQFVKLKGVAGDFFNQLISDVIRLQIRQAMAGGGLLGGILKLVGGASGTAAASTDIVVNNNAVSSAFAKLPGFSSGGWTGGGGRGKVKGVVHGEEYVFDAEATARIGVDTLDAMRAGRLTNRVPSMPSIGSAERALSMPPGLVRVEVVGGELFDARVAGISGNVSAQVAASTAPAIVGAATGQATTSMVQRARRQLR